MGQCSVFVRNREQFAQPPFNLKIDEGRARLTDFISTLALKGLGARLSHVNRVSAFTTDEHRRSARLTSLVASRCYPYFQPTPS